MLDENFRDIAAVFSLPEPYRKRLRTSNSIERLNEELRRSERVIRIFPNQDSLDRLIGSVFIEHYERWISSKVYFDREIYNQDKDTALAEADKIRQAYVLNT